MFAVVLSECPLVWIKKVKRHLVKRSSAVQPRKWWLIGNGTWRKLAAPIVRATDFWPAVMRPIGICYAPINHTRPSLYLITWITTHLRTPEGWMAELAMLADRQRMSDPQSVKQWIRPASSLAKGRESSPAETSVLPILLRRQLITTYKSVTKYKQN